MSCFALKKPLHPVKKVWIRLTAAVRKLRRSRPVATILPVRPSDPRFHVQHGKNRKRFHARKSSHHRSFAPVYIDELFSRDATVHVGVEKTMKSELTTVGTSSSGEGEKVGGKLAKSEWETVGTSSSREGEKMGGKMAKSEWEAVGTSSSREGEKVGGKMAKSEWETVGTSSSSRAIGDLGEVDLRAEMFIARFKDEMRLERQRSFGEYHEMLARGV